MPLPLRHCFSFTLLGLLLLGCQDKSAESTPATAAPDATSAGVAPPKVIYDRNKFINQPLVSHIYTADPSAHVFNGRLYIYPSRDIPTDKTPNETGDHFDMRDYHVLSLEKPGDPVVDHGVALTLEDVPWASRQLWAPDATEKDGKYYLYFPAKNKEGIFQIGVALSDSPTGPFNAEPEPIKGSFSIDPAVFKDDDGSYYLYFGGIRGGQLQRWTTGTYSDTDAYPASNQPALSPKIARLSDDMLQFAEVPRDVLLQDEGGTPLLGTDNNRRFFEAAWVHKYNGKYYFSYSTGDTHYIAYGVGDSPYGPFTYKGIVLTPVLGWTTHHSIVEYQGKWYLFYHDAQLSGGETHLRNIKVTELVHHDDGSIQPIVPYSN
ncbi:glycoside hydrolase family 43 protein [Cellvibrio japonicus]|uniref:Beta-xylosidase/alpha-L-arabinfuranosidase, putative, gly43G n=1 Tax=Cellvibrio japonicus (strain Ueda107) TaxID=498211 RepID=B3PDB2_CELJU|nr:glycoside hydrolase family 43 protein [Cellvibrio japonicus]ACE82692.1 beta-xylosidase/alpha-L-arabinfuranosidase, putative, gly43G [Cellvibrio japonicus Ueda107]QEI13367.1 family 43 glycosylhydrolase [Cellvibrio japonicus]QEI16941.1 family 43 glycosylhydrolase [Cellvibrio japonicus]QEI20519.1 family 43 glycosylhydrolase [Cellvibrio japonicus]